MDLFQDETSKMNKKINDRIFDNFPKLESERLIFRSFTKEDAQDILLLKSNDEVMMHMDAIKHQTIQDSEKAIIKNQNLFKERQGIIWAIIEKSTREFIGYFGFWRLIREHCRAEIGYALKPQFWSKGFMRESMNLLIDFGFNELKLHSIEANLNPKNENSERLLKNFGFKKEAYFRENYLFNGTFNDSIIYSLLEKDIK